MENNKIQTLEINIKLDPINDGAVVKEIEDIRKDEGALVIGTNRESRRVTPEEADDIIEKLSGHCEGEFIANTPFIAIFYEDRAFTYHGSRYFIGSMIIMKSTRKGLTFLTGDEFEAAEKVFKSRLVTFMIHGQSYLAYELV